MQFSALASHWLTGTGKAQAPQLLWVVDIEYPPPRALQAGLTAGGATVSPSLIEAAQGMAKLQFVTSLPAVDSSKMLALRVFTPLVVYLVHKNRGVYI